jgi:hypothetical protein
MKASVFSSIAAIAFVAAAPAQEKLTFPTEWKVGKTYVQTSTMEQTMNMMGQGEMVMKIGMEMTAVPKEGPGGSTEVTMTYNKMDMNGQMGGQDLPGLGDSSAKLVGKSIVVKFDENGEVTGVDASGLQIDGDPMAAQMLNPDNLKQMVSQGTLLARPEQPVGPGESWKFSRKQPNPVVELTLDGTYTFEKIEDIDGSPSARLVYGGTMTGGLAEEKEGAEPNPQREMMKAMDLKVTNGKVSGVSHYDLALKQITRAETHMEMTMTMNNPSTGEPMDMPVKMHLTQTLKASDAE